LIRWASSRITRSGADRRSLGLPVLDPLGLVEDHEIGRVFLNDRQVAEQLLVVDEQHPVRAAPVQPGAVVRVTVDGDKLEIGERPPLARPLRLERRRDHHEGSADLRASKQRVTRRDRLRGLAEAHVVGEQQPARVQEPLDTLALVRKQLLPEPAHQPVELA
jgi:hypothetical protein